MKKTNNYKIISAAQSELIVYSSTYGKIISTIDTHSIKKLKKYTWSVEVRKKEFRIKTCFREKGKIKNIYLSRYLLNFPENKVDHIDGNPLNNLISNLRTCTTGENNRNQKTREGTKTGIRGVNQSKRNGKWRVRISVNSRRIYLGTFDNLEAAKATYESAAEFYYKDFKRRLNEKS